MAKEHQTILKANSIDEESSSSSSGSEKDGSSSSSSNAVEFEGVSASEFESFEKDLNKHLDFLTASSIVLIFAVFFCIGILAVQTLIRSFEVR